MPPLPSGHLEFPYASPSPKSVDEWFPSNDTLVEHTLVTLAPDLPSADSRKQIYSELRSAVFQRHRQLAGDLLFPVSYHKILPTILVQRRIYSNPAVQIQPFFGRVTSSFSSSFLPASTSGATWMKLESVFFSSSSFMEILVNFEGSRRVVSVEDSSDLLVAVERELARRCPGRDIAIAPVDTKLSQSGSKEVYILQKCTEKWGYVDVTDSSQVKGGDEITLVKMPKLEENSGLSHKGESSNLHQHTLTAVSRVTKPTKSEAAALGKLFPSSPSLPKLPSSFDPGSECVFASQKRKKKSSRVKPSKLTLTLLPLGSSAIPRGKHRKILENGGRLKKVEFYREMSSQVVQNKIITAFVEQEDFHSTYSLLLQSQDGRLTLADNQFPTGEQFVEEALKHRGNVYLTPKKKVVAGSDSSPQSSDSDLPNVSVRKKTKMVCSSGDVSGSSSSRSVLGSSATGSGGFIIPTSSSGSGGGVVAVIVPGSVASSGEKDGGIVSSSNGGGVSFSGSGSDGCVLSGSSSGGASSISANLEEWRQVRQEQDAAFQESLHIDQLKDRRQECKKQQIEHMQASLQEKFAFRNEEGSGMKIIFRLPNSEKVEQYFLLEESVQVLYEFVFSTGHLGKCFTIYQAIPRAPIIMDGSTLLQRGIKSGVFVVEESDYDVMEVLNSACDPQEQDMSKVILKEDAAHRKAFLLSVPGIKDPSCHELKRKNIYNEVLALYRNEEVFLEHPLRIKFENEKAIDFGGVCRDMFAAFWKASYQILFDGSSQLTPVIHAQTDISVYPLLGCILSHGFLECGYLPVRIAFPCLSAMLLDFSNLSDSILIEAFANSISPVESSFLKGCFTITSSIFSSGVQEKLINLFSRYGSRQLPTPITLRQQVLQVARYEFLVKPMTAISMIKGGIPSVHLPFWKSFSLTEFHSLYKSLTASPAKVLSMIEEPTALNQSQARIFSYLQQYIGNMRSDEVQRFLRFVTGSSVCVSNDIKITFNTLSGLARRPISHTCTYTLELSSEYLSYLDFSAELSSVLGDDENSWIMDAM